MEREASTVYHPCYQVKAAGHVVDSTNSHSKAHESLREATKPAELWLVQANGAAQCVARTK